MQPVSFKKIWGEATAYFDRPRHSRWIDLMLIVGLAGMFFLVLSLAQEATYTQAEAVKIDLSPWALPRYTLYSLIRGLIAYALSLGFTLVYGYWAAKDPVAERVLVPLLDILQSIPVLSFLPAVSLALIGLFPHSSIGLELTCIILIFTGQAWNMTFSFYHSLRSIPQDQQEVATVYRFNWWQRFRWLELPSATIGLVWNSMMSMAGGWFFLVLCEAPEILYQDQTLKFRLPGIGAYMKAVEDADIPTGQRFSLYILAVAAMMLMIILLDQLLWRPVVAWSQKFRVEEGGNQEKVTSWFLEFLRRSHLVARLTRWLENWPKRRPPKWNPEDRPFDPLQPRAWTGWLSAGVFLALLAGLGYAAWELVALIANVSFPQFREIFKAAGLTLGRVLSAVALGTLWALPAGLVIGLSPRLSRILQPIVQVLASFPAPMLFPMLVFVFEAMGIHINWYSAILMLAGTQWYILFNIIAGSMAIPADLKEAATSYRITRWQRFKVLYFPSIFPYLVTGWVTAAGGAWNASIVAEYYNDGQYKAKGLGAIIAENGKNFPVLAASTIIMAAVVVLFNRLVWKRLYKLAEERYSLNK